MSCSLCGKRSGIARPHPACAEGTALYEEVRAARNKHDATRGGDETYQGWQARWRKWVRHHKTPRRRSRAAEPQPEFL